jgi:galactokinase
VTESDVHATAQSTLAEFVARFRRQPKLYRAPARVNIIGEHTDYNDGFVLPTAIALHTWIAIAPRTDRTLHVYSCKFDSVKKIDLDRIEKTGSGQWLEYIKGVASTLENEGCALRGADIVIDGEIPLGSGLSSSASLETVLAFALLDCAGVAIDRSRLAQSCQRAESDFVGVRCGIMDQYVISCCTKGHAMMLDCRSLEYDLVAMSEDVRLVIVDSGVHHQLPDGEYNTRRQECEEAVALLKKENPQLSSLRDLSLDQLEASRQRLGDGLFRRCRHVVTENHRVGDAHAALGSNDVERLGQLVTASHTSLRDDFEVSCAEVDALVEIANRCAGVYGTRMVGAGFGGCTISLVAPAYLSRVVDGISSEYGKRLGRSPWIHVATSSDPVQEVALTEVDGDPLP